MTTPAEEASEILVRMLNCICAGMGKQLKPEHKAEIRRACELLSQDGTLAPLADLPRVSPVDAMVEAAIADPNYQRWKQERNRER